MFPFVKVSDTKSNLSLAKEGGEEAFDEDQYEDEQNNEDENKEDEGNERHNKEDQYEANELDNPLKKYGRNWRKARHVISETKLKVRKREKFKIEKEEIKALQVIDKLALSGENKGKCEIFGELISTKLKNFNQKESLLAKHEIQNVLFKIPMQSLEFDSNDRLTELTAKTTMQYPSASTSTLVALFQSIAQPSYQPFQSPHSDGLGIKPLEFFMKKVQDEASFNIM